ncbi:hypothetical protein DAPPUDRAFT_106895 [Daphnia pulex]|uniref:Uncharacterized protein n=1 Tax=Daphnia pulex TaxID=6669 RepID=E9GVB7_DAPPU|nr:hypothetical protein DAPPUDRAFT_106895 [Daphnia pulex]|eukprot:EFX76633.1 hypothetical protein DAPPUDRAFT_106895 [Daphnia pulex]
MRNESAFRNTAIERVTKDVKLLTLLVLRTQMDPFQNFQYLVANVPVIQSIVGAAINFPQEIVSQPARVYMYESNNVSAARCSLRFFKCDEIYCSFVVSEKGYTVPKITKLLGLQQWKIKYNMRKAGFRSRQFSEITNSHLDCIVRDIIRMFPNSGFKNFVGKYKISGPKVSRHRSRESFCRVKDLRRDPPRRTIKRRDVGKMQEAVRKLPTYPTDECRIDDFLMREEMRNLNFDANVVTLENAFAIRSLDSLASPGVPRLNPELSFSSRLLTTIIGDVRALFSCLVRASCVSSTWAPLVAANVDSHRFVLCQCRWPALRCILLNNESLEPGLYSLPSERRTTPSPHAN